MTTHPVLGLTVSHQELVLRPVDDDLADRLAVVAEEGWLRPGEEHFTSNLSAARAALPDANRRAFAFRTYHRKVRSSWVRGRWQLHFAVIVDGQPAGVQTLATRAGEAFPHPPVLATGSWLGLPWQGRGYGTRARALCLHVAFSLFCAERVETSWVSDNTASARVSEKLGYRLNGTDLVSYNKVTRVLQRAYQDRDGWADAQPVWLAAANVAGAEPARQFLLPA